jgi:hypothetical protein
MEVISVSRIMDLSLFWEVSKTITKLKSIKVEKKMILEKLSFYLSLFY